MDPFSVLHLQKNDCDNGHLCMCLHGPENYGDLQEVKGKVGTQKEESAWIGGRPQGGGGGVEAPGLDREEEGGRAAVVYLSV
jgi:hypothetical protein